jgi:hypothetical protein
VRDTRLTTNRLGSRPGGFSLELTMNGTLEIIGLLYVALAIAAGGSDLLEDSNDILRAAIDRGSLSPDARQMLKALVATTSKQQSSRSPRSRAP